MRTILSVELIIKIIEANKLDVIPELARAKPHLMISYTELKRVGGLGELPKTGCTECAKKNIKYRKQSLLTVAVMSLDMARQAGDTLSNIMGVIAELEGHPVTQLDLIIPTSVPLRTNGRTVNAGNSIVMQGTK